MPSNDGACNWVIPLDCTCDPFHLHPSIDVFIFSFLNDLKRIASRDYVVTDDDIMRARLRTVGIQEHSLFFKQGPWDNPKCKQLQWFTNIFELIVPLAGKESGWEWRMFDVGGCRTTVGEPRFRGLMSTLNDLIHAARSMASLFRQC